ncbi:MAG: LuxR family transcriptional regulator [Candidatus Dormibacteraceae bacterium]
MAARTVTFLLTDVEGSTRRWAEAPDLMRTALVIHDALVGKSIQGAGGIVLTERGEGDSFFAIFTRATDAVAAALTIQRELAAATWPAELVLRVRAAIHTGETGDDYRGPDVNRTARLRNLARGGQVVVSAATATLVGDRLPEGAELVDLGLRQLKDLTGREHVFQLRHPDLALDPVAVSLDTAPHNLRPARTSFVGRDAELAATAGLLATRRLVTLTGTGGTGKTRLALAAAERAVGDFEGGAWLVELSSVGGAGLVAGWVATVLGIRERPGVAVQELVIDSLRGRRLLLVLDSCEHLVEEVAALTTRVLEECPQIVILATSRETLGLPGESVLAVPPLAVDEDSEATVLLVERIADHKPGFAPTDSQREAIRAIVRGLDGMPLAIELVAARARSMSLVDIASRLDEQLRLLDFGPRGVPGRLRSLTAALEWSARLLTADERRLFGLISVFTGGFDANAAAALFGGPPTDLIGQLVDKSMLVPVPGVRGRSRYRLLEPVRQFAARLLEEGGGTEIALRDHALHYAALALEAAKGLRGARLPLWLDRLDEEVSNLRAAIGWLLRNRRDLAIAVLIGLNFYWLTRGDARAVLAWLDEGLAGRETYAPESLGRLLSTRALLRLQRDGPESALPSAADAVEVTRQLDDPGAQAETFVAMGQVLIEAGDAQRARPLLTQAYELARASTDPYLIVHTGTVWAISEFIAGNPVASNRIAAELVPEARELGHPGLIAHLIMVRGRSLFFEGRLTEANELWAEALCLVRLVNSPELVSFCLHWLALIAAQLGDHGTAAAISIETIAVARRVPSPAILAYRLGYATSVLVALDRLVPALVLEACSTAIPTQLPSSPLWTKRQAELMATARTTVGGEATAEAERVGRAMSVEAGAAYAVHEFSRILSALPPGSDSGARTLRDRQIAALRAAGLDEMEIAARLNIPTALLGR